VKATIPIAVQPGTRVLRLERVPNRAGGIGDMRGYWQFWIAHDRQMTQGTFIRLYDDGSITQHTVDADGVETNTFRVKDADK
jgi:hypothetical protein